MITDKLAEMIGSEYTAMSSLYTDAIFDCAKSIKDEYLDDRYREILMSSVMSHLLKHNVWIVPTEDNEGVDMMFPDKLPQSVEDKIKPHGGEIASLFLSPSPAPFKDNLSEIAAITLLCSRMLVDKIATDMTSYKERAAILSGVLRVMDAVAHNMITELPDPKGGSRA